MNENRDDKFQEEYDVDVMADDTEDIDLIEEDDDIGDLSDFEGEEEQSKSKFLFGKNKNANSEKKPLDKKNLIILLGGVGIVLILQQKKIRQRMFRLLQNLCIQELRSKQTIQQEQGLI